MSTKNPDVVIVGAGPVGLVAACDLARRGVSIRIVDKLAAPTDEAWAPRHETAQMREAMMGLQVMWGIIRVREIARVSGLNGG